MAGKNFDMRPDTFIDRRDGQTRSFTVIDHSKKQKVYMNTDIGLDYTPELYKENYINKLKLYNPVFASKDMIHLLKRGEGVDTLGWNDAVLENYTWVEISDFHTIVSNAYKIAQQMKGKHEFPDLE